MHRRLFFTSTKTLRLIRDMGYDQKQMYCLVSDIHKYKEFIPGIKESTVSTTINDALSAELVFGLDQVNQKFVSQVQLYPCKRIIATCKNGNLLFDNLVTIWDFIYISQNSTKVQLMIDLKFHNPMIAKVSGLLLDDSASKILKCFEKRAYQLYGEPKSH